MPEDARRETLRRGAMQLLALETDLEVAVGRQLDTAREDLDVSAVIERAHAMIRAQRDAMRAYAESIGASGAAPGTSVVAALFAPSTGGTEPAPEPSLSEILRADHAAFSYSASGYGALFEVALRLYEPPLRELAPKHLGAYAEAARSVNRLIAGVTARELAASGLDCQCVCPMCGIGACGCVALASARLRTAWNEPAPEPAGEPGFALERPRSDSQLAIAGVRRGDRLVAIDGEPVRAVPEVQAAIRRHAVGERLRLTVQRGSEARDLAVTHVSDYPSAK